MKYYGFGKIFQFTFIQRIKTAGYCRSTAGGALLCCLLPLVILVCVEVFTGKTKTPLNKVAAVYVVDQTGLAADYNILNQIGREGYSEITYTADTDFEHASAQAEEKENSAILVVESGAEKEVLSLILPEGSNLSKDDLDGMEYFLSSAYPYVQMQKTGLNAEELAELTAPVAVSAHKAADEEEDQLAGVRDMMSFVIPYLNIMVLYFLVLFYGQGVAGSVLMEKTSRLMDTFLLCVEPGGMILGKVLAHVLAALLQIGSWLLGLTAGFSGGAALVRMIHPDTKMVLLSFFDSFGEVSGLFTVSGIVAALLQIAAGFLLYCSLAAIGGAIAGKQEELSTTNLLFTMALVVSFLAVITSGGLGTVQSSSNWMYWVPFSAVLVVPGRVLLGQIPVWISYASLAVVLALSVLITLAAGRLYQAMALYKGKLPKAAELLRMLRG